MAMPLEESAEFEPRENAIIMAIPSKMDKQVYHQVFEHSGRQSLKKRKS